MTTRGFRLAVWTSFAWLALLAVMGCHNKQDTRRETLKLRVTSPLKRDTTLTKQYVCQIRAIQHIELRALEKGYLQGIFVDEGEHLEKGQKMFQIMPLLYQAELNKAQAEAKFTDIEYQNTKTLTDDKVVSPKELALAKAKVAKTDAELALAKAHRGLTEIHAPFSGIMGPFHVRLGSLVNEGDLLTTLSDNSTVWAYFNVTEAEYLDYAAQFADDEAKTVRLVMANGRTFDLPGKLETIEADFDNQTGNIAFRAGFPNPKGLLRHGETGTILFPVPLGDALVIPQEATFSVLGKKFVFVVDKQNVVRTREIKIGAEMPQVYIIKSGLTEHDRFLLEGLRKVKDGSHIEPNYEEPKKVLAHLDLPAE